MKKNKLLFKDLLICLIILLLLLGYVRFILPVFMAIIFLSPKWCEITNIFSFIFFLIHFPVLIFCVVNIWKRSFKKSLLLILFFILSFALPSGIYQVEKSFYSNFTSNKWQRRDNSRFLMLDDMLETNNLIGKNKIEILELLGSETSLENIPIKIPKTLYDDHLVYYLGRSVDGVFHSEDDYLVIYLNNNVVKEHKILKDTFDF